MERCPGFLKPASAIAGLILVGLIANEQFGLLSGAGGGENKSALDDPGAFTYHDYLAGTTLVWLTYPAQNEFADNDSTDTLQ